MLSNRYFTLYPFASARLSLISSSFPHIIAVVEHTSAQPGQGAVLGCSINNHCLQLLCIRFISSCLP